MHSTLALWLCLGLIKMQNASTLILNPHASRLLRNLPPKLNNGRPTIITGGKSAIRWYVHGKELNNTVLAELLALYWPIRE
jgi:hypothetical protein